MTTRSAPLGKPDSQGQYTRQLGWKLNSNGKRVQHKFRLGRDRREAEHRVHLLRNLWEAASRRLSAPEPLWDDETLQFARHIAKGDIPVPIAPLADGETPSDYKLRALEIQLRYSFVRFTTTDRERFELGLGNDWPEMKKFVLQQLDHFAHYDPALFVRGTQNLQATTASEIEAPPLDLPNERTRPDQSLHSALDTYASWIREEYFDADLGDVTDNGLNRIRRVKSLKHRHDDVKIDTLGFDAVEQMYRFWRKRPFKKPHGKQQKQTVQKRVSPATVRHFLAELNAFFKWLHRSEKFAWRKPDDFDDINRRQARDVDHVRRTLNQVETFTLQDLQLLNRYASPEERLLLLLGLNCGFGAKEIATLRIGELNLHQALPLEQQELYDFPSTNADSFLSVVRSKTAVAGMYLLFEQTVQMLDWVWERRQTQPDAESDQPLIVNQYGLCLDVRTRGGNRSAQIPNRFDRLKKRIKEDGHSLNNLSFKFLRKTAGDLIRRFSDGEVSGVFLLHGQAVKSDSLADVYTNRPFGKVFNAIREVEAYLTPVFAEVTGDPTKQKIEPK